jgi:hypothetical protein
VSGYGPGGDLTSRRRNPVTHVSPVTNTVGLLRCWLLRSALCGATSAWHATGGPEWQPAIDERRDGHERAFTGT